MPQVLRQPLLVRERQLRLAKVNPSLTNQSSWPGSRTFSKLTRVAPIFGLNRSSRFWSLRNACWEKALSHSEIWEGIRDDTESSGQRHIFDWLRNSVGSSSKLNVFYAVCSWDNFRAVACWGTKPKIHEMLERSIMLSWSDQISNLTKGQHALLR